MKNITKETFGSDWKVLKDMLDKYSKALYENQEAQPAHYDNQPKLIRICIEDVRCGLMLATYAMNMLDENKEYLIED